MNEFAVAPANDRHTAFVETAARMGVNPLIVEKDFWVCWCLGRLFEIPDLPGHIFKGGTSLSKVYGLIRRFSEDIDISLNRAELGFGKGNDPADKELSGKKRQKLRDELAGACTTFIEAEMLPLFQEACRSILGTNGWSAAMDERDPDRQSILFQYPTSLPEYQTDAYLGPSVLFEFGCRGDQWPSSEATIQPFVATEFPTLIRNPQVKVIVLDAERTFWEKVTLIHAENYRPTDRPSRERLSRHYSDVAQIFRSELGAKAIANTILLDQVVEHKQIFFPSGWAHYDTAKPGSMKLVPDADMEKQLRSDYEGMREMFFGEIEDFDAVMGTIRELQTLLNAEKGD
jgi:hypothetical protein